MKENARTSIISLLCFGLISFTLLNSVASAAPDNMGTDFWLAFPRDQVGAQQIKLYITAGVDTTGMVTISGLGFSEVFVVTAGDITSVDLPTAVVLTQSDGVENLGIHVTSVDEVTVYGFSIYDYITDAFLALPTSVLGTEHILLSYNNGVFGGTQFAVAATQDGTTVTIIPSVTTGGRAGGIPYVISLNQGETYRLVNHDVGVGYDLSGTIITSDVPVAVFGSHECPNVPAAFIACDYLIEQFPAVASWGTNFVTMPLATRLNGDTFRFLSSEDGTKVWLNGSLVTTLQRGEFHERMIDGPAQIESDHPILIAQYSNGESYDSKTGDPFMMLVPPFEQFLNQYTVITPNAGFAINYMNIVVADYCVGQIEVDGFLIPPGDYVPIDTSGFSGVQVPVGVGAHSLSGPCPFGVFVYGFDTMASYGYPGGMSLAPVAEVVSIVLTPKTATNQIDTQHCVVARVTNGDGDPVVGVRVDFNVTGANPTVGFAFTDTNGEAPFCYTGSNEGDDTITASVGEISDTANKTWVYYSPTFTSSATQSSTYTETATPTATPSETPSDTETSTLSATPTATPTYTPTSTHTYTGIETYTPTITETDSPTYTRTHTRTVTRTETESNTPTDTATFTNTPTMTPTSTRTATLTVTSTNTHTTTLTKTHTVTFSPSTTRTTTPTPTPYFSFQVDIVNEAGEVVKIFHGANSGELPGDIELRESEVIFDVGGGVFRDLHLGDWWTITWDGSLDDDEMIPNGAYHVIVRVTDVDGQRQEDIGTLVVMKVAGDFKVTVRNEGGRLIRSIGANYGMGNLGALSAEPRLIKPGSGHDERAYIKASGCTLIMGNNEKALYWDGRNEDGQIVQSGVYRIVVEKQNIEGGREVKEVEVTVVRGAGGAIDNVIVSPNPKVITGGDTTVRVRYDVIMAGAAVKVKVYDIAGELVLRAESRDTSKDYVELVADKLAGGIYIVLVEATAEGSSHVFRRMKKLVILK